jgi:sugar transferase (PEP-CTERM/EpsH1 system associated)
MVAVPTARKRILFLTPQLPFPPEQGTALRNYNLIAQVARRHDVALLSFGEPSADPGPLAQLCHPLCLVPAPRRTLRRRLWDLLRSRRPDMALRLASPAYADALRALLRQESFDLIQVEGLEMAPYAELVRGWLGPRAPKMILDAHNAEYLLQRRALETDLRLPARWPAALYSWIQWRRLRAFERAACRRADGLVAVSEADAQALKALDDTLCPLVVPNGVDLERYHPGLPDSLPLHHPAVVFTGKMDFRPNVDAALWFYRRCWPLVRRAVPEAHFYVVGKQPHPRLASLRADPSVTLTGYVPDILPYFGGADVYVAPLRMGGGTRLKILEAMAAGLPLVSTTLGAEGIALIPGEHALLADTPAQMAEAVITLLRDGARARVLGMAARRFVELHYSWEKIAPRLEALYAAAGCSPAAPI